MCLPSQWLWAMPLTTNSQGPLERTALLQNIYWWCFCLQRIHSRLKMLLLPPHKTWNRTCYSLVLCTLQSMFIMTSLRQSTFCSFLTLIPHINQRKTQAASIKVWSSTVIDNVCQDCTFQKGWELGAKSYSPKTRIFLTRLHHSKQTGLFSFPPRKHKVHNGNKFRDTMNSIYYRPIP